MASGEGAARQETKVSSSSSSYSSLARSRSQSRGRRTNPSEALARKQQLLRASKSSQWLNTNNSQGYASDDNDEDDDAPEEYNAEDDEDGSGGGGGDICEDVLDQDKTTTSRNVITTFDSRRESRRRKSLKRRDELSLKSINNNNNNNNKINIKTTSQNNEQSAELKLQSLASEISDNNFISTRNYQRLAANCSPSESSMTTTSKYKSDTNSSPSPSSSSFIDIDKIIAKKDKDLRLAAEVGKALLEKNEELSKANERIAEEYSQKLEILEEEKHKLNRKIKLLESEYESRICDLNADNKTLKNQLDEQQNISKRTEKEKSKLINELMQQNQRLTSELSESTKAEESLALQLELLDEKLSDKRDRRNEKMGQLETLSGELEILGKRRQDLERRLKVSLNDKLSLQARLDEYCDKLALADSALLEAKSVCDNHETQLCELRASSNWLLNELEFAIQMNERLSNGNNQDDKHLAGELNDSLTSPSANTNGYGYEERRAKLVEQIRYLRRKQLEYGSNIGFHEQSVMQQQFESSELKLRNQVSAENNNDDDDDEFPTIPEALIEVFGLLRKFCVQLRARRHALGASSDNSVSINGTTGDDSGISNANDEDDDDYDDDDADGYDGFEEDDNIENSNSDNKHILANSSNDFGNTSDVSTRSNINNDLSRKKHLDSRSSDNKKRKLVRKEKKHCNPSIKDWQALLSNVKSLLNDLPCATCQTMIIERNDYEQLKRWHAKLVLELKHKSEQLVECESKVIDLETKLSIEVDKCKLLRNDLENCDNYTQADSLVKMAWKVRDEAVERKNSVQISLAKSRIEVMQISSQLIEVVQQKAELSQKLAQFEDDIHSITQNSVRAKFTMEEYIERIKRSHQNNQAAMTNLASKQNFAFNSPLSQLFSFTSSNQPQQPQLQPQLQDRQQQQQQQQPVAGSEEGDSPTVHIIRNLTNSKFNLKFWQRNSDRPQRIENVDKRTTDTINTTKKLPQQQQQY